MTKVIIIFLSILPSFLIGQETLIMSVVNEKPYFKEVYCVLKSDTSIKHGSYQKLNYKDEIITKGFYKNGLKDSLWREFQFQNGIRYLKEMGTYVLDKKAGIWEFCDINGVTDLKYDFTKKEVVNALPYNQEVNVIKGKDTIKTKLDRRPVYLAGLDNSIAVDSIKLKYPLQALENGITGKVYVAILINKDGKAINYRVIKGIGGGCDEEAINYVKKLPNQWAPGILKGQPVNSEYILPVGFIIR